MNETAVRKIVKEETTDIRDDVKDLKGDVKDLKGEFKDLKEDVRHIGLIQEQHTEILATIGEGIQNLQGLPKQLDVMNNRVTRLEIDMDIVKPMVKDHSSDIAKLKSHTGLD